MTGRCPATPHCLPAGRQEGAQLKHYFLCWLPARHCVAGEPIRHTQCHELCRTAAACLSRPNEVAGELRSVKFIIRPHYSHESKELLVKLLALKGAASR
jgi:hypothetical protein